MITNTTFLSYIITLYQSSDVTLGDPLPETTYHDCQPQWSGNTSNIDYGSQMIPAVSI